MNSASNYELPHFILIYRVLQTTEDENEIFTSYFRHIFNFINTLHCK